MRKIFTLTIFAIMLSACGLSAYDETTPFGVFSKENINGNMWRVRFVGDGDKTIETAQTYWLYRCALLTLKQGYTGFRVLSNIHFVRSLIPTDGSASFFPIDDYYVPVPNPYYKTGPTIEADVELLKGPIAPVSGKVFDAIKLKAAIEPHISGEYCDKTNICPHAHDYLYPRDTI